jgi:hypothetical protein
MHINELSKEERALIGQMLLWGPGEWVMKEEDVNLFRTVLEKVICSDDTEAVFLSRRNLTYLLKKLDRVKNGENSACTIIKRDDQHPVYPQTMAALIVTALEDEDYYTNRKPGPMYEDEKT